MKLKDKYLDRIADALEEQMGVSPKLIGGNVLKPNIYRIADALDPEPTPLKDGTLKNPLARIADVIESGGFGKADIPVLSVAAFNSMNYNDFIQYEKFVVSDDTSGFKQGILYDGTKATPNIDLVTSCIVDGVLNQNYSIAGNELNVIIEENKVLFKPQGIGNGVIQFHKKVKLKDKIELAYEIVRTGVLTDFSIKAGTTIGGNDVFVKPLRNGDIYENNMIREIDVSSYMDTEVYISVYNGVTSRNTGMLYLTSLIV